MFGPRITALVALLVMAATVQSKTFTRCGLARELVRKGLPRDQINDWVCLVEGESSRRTHVVGPPNTDGSKDYGLFQINSRYWCTESGPADKECNIRCRDLLDDSLNDDIECVHKIYNVHGFSAWTAWVAKCKGGKAADVSSCFK